MTLYTIGTQPQAIYPDGLQSSFAITNDGPWTVLVDQESSIGPGSYEIPPLATIVWDRHRALWIMAKPPPSTPSAGGAGGYVNSNVRITRNTDAITARGNATVKLANINYIGADTGADSEVFETNTFSSIIINLEHIPRYDYTTTAAPNANNPDIADGVTTIVQWYSSTGALTQTDVYYSPFQDSSVGSAWGGAMPQRLVIPVLDAYCYIRVRKTSGTGIVLQQVFKYQVYGQLRELTSAFHYWTGPAGGSSLVYPAWPRSISTDYQLGSDSFTLVEWSNAAVPGAIWISPVKPRLLVRLRATSVTVAGTLFLETVNLSTLTLDSITIPIATQSDLELDTLIPLSRPLRLRHSCATGIIRLVLTWSD